MAYLFLGILCAILGTFSITIINYIKKDSVLKKHPIILILIGISFIGFGQYFWYLVGQQSNSDITNQIDTSINSNFVDFKNSNSEQLRDIDNKYSELLELIKKYNSESKSKAVSDSLELSTNKTISEIEQKWSEIKSTWSEL